MAQRAAAPSLSGGLLHAGPVAAFIAGRCLVALFTLLLLSLIVFAAGQLLPGDVGRATLGPFADAAAVAALNHQLGADRPFALQYVDWLGRLLHGDLGRSTAYQASVASLLGDAVLRSAKLAALAFAIVVPLGCALGICAAMHARRWPDRLISIATLAVTVVPEFVSGIALILLFCIVWRIAPMSADYPDGAGLSTQFGHLIMPALPLVFVFVGYIARMARSGTIEALAADYTRTAVLKGLPWRTVLLRHVLRNALPPTLAVATTQLGYLFGGLVVVENLFQYPGLGRLIYNAAHAHDFPMLEAGVLCLGVVYTVSNLLVDAASVRLDPRQAERAH
jgi:peptide/nickel transport system permease protein